jgi:hypothetical protein
MGSLRNAANVKTGLPLFELERQAGITIGTIGMTGNHSDSFNPERLERFERLERLERLLHVR